MQTITATFEDGVLKPTHPLNLPNHVQVRITIEPLERDLQKEERLAALESVWRISKVHSEEHLTRDQLHERR